MAKARDIPIDPDEPYAQTAARVVRVRADELFSDREDVLDVSDIERVHAMRVASRRLRAVLEIFAPCFPKAEYREVLQDVKALADALAELSQGPAEPVAARLGLAPERVRLLPAGILVLEAAADRLGCPLELACGGVREGVCLDAAASSAH